MVDINLVASSCQQARKETGGFNDLVGCRGVGQGVAVCHVTSILLETKEELLIFVCLAFFLVCIVWHLPSFLHTGWETRSWLNF